MRSLLEDEDIEMSGMGPSTGHARFISQRGRKGNRGRTGSPVPKGGYRRRLFEGPTNWYKVTVRVLSLIFFA